MSSVRQAYLDVQCETGVYLDVQCETGVPGCPV